MTDGLGTFYVLTTIHGETYDLPESQGDAVLNALHPLQPVSQLRLQAFEGQLVIFSDQIGQLLLTSEADRERERERCDALQRAWENRTDNDEPWSG